MTEPFLTPCVWQELKCVYWNASVGLRVLMGLTDRRKTAKYLVDSRKNWKILTVRRK